MSFVATEPYVDRDYADDYFAEQLNTSVWDNAENSEKDKALKMATNLLNTFDWIGIKSEHDQVNEFPRSQFEEEDGDGIPLVIKFACCETAKQFLAGKSVENQFQQDNLTSQSVGDTSESYANTNLQSLKGGALDIYTAQLISPWLRNRERFTRLRVS